MARSAPDVAYPPAMTGLRRRRHLAGAGALAAAGVLGGCEAITSTFGGGGKSSPSCTSPTSTASCGHIPSCSTDRRRTPKEDLVTTGGMPAVAALAKKIRAEKERTAFLYIGDTFHSSGLAVISSGMRLIVNADDLGRSAGHNVEVASLLKILARIAEDGPGTTELMCHPGEAADAELLATSSYARERPVELATLCDPAIRDAVEQHELMLSTFRDVARCATRATPFFEELRQRTAKGDRFDANVADAAPPQRSPRAACARLACPRHLRKPGRPLRVEAAQPREGDRKVLPDDR